MSRDETISNEDAIICKEVVTEENISLVYDNIFEQLRYQLSHFVKARAWSIALCSTVNKRL